MMICPGCYTKPPSGTTPTFSRIFSMARNWSTSINHISTHSTKLHQSTILNLNKNKLLMVGISTRATRGDEVLFTPRPPLSRPCACAYLSRCFHLQSLHARVPRQICLPAYLSRCSQYNTRTYSVCMNVYVLRQVCASAYSSMCLRILVQVLTS